MKVSSLYKALAGTEAAIEDEENDLRINSGATDAQLEWKRRGDLVLKKKPGREDLEAFETAYNAACGSIARGELGQGEVLLKRAKGGCLRCKFIHVAYPLSVDLCSSLDELSDQEKDAELLPICVQQLYVLIRLGKSEEAEKIASEIAVEEYGRLPFSKSAYTDFAFSIPDLSTRQIAQNNKLASTTVHANPYLSHRLFNSAADLPKTDKLFGFQANQMRHNSFALDLLAAKSSGVFATTSKLLSDKPPTTSSYINILSLINAAARAQSELGKLGLKKILPLLDQRPNDVGLALTIVQLYILTNNHGSAITVMESLLKRLEELSQTIDQDVRFAPGLVAVTVSLYTLQGRKSQIKTELAKAASYWRHKSKPQTTLLRAAGISLLESSKPDDLATARQIFSTLHSQDPTSKFATAGFVAAHALESPSEVSVEAETLTPVNRLTAGIDAAALEAAGVPQAAAPSAIDETIRRKRALDEKPKPAKKRIRKSKLPKDYDPSKTPDPERWLPVRDRSSYRPKGRKGKQKAAALTQGGVSEKGEGCGKGGGEGVIKAANPGPGAPGKGKKKKGKK